MNKQVTISRSDFLEGPDQPGTGASAGANVGAQQFSLRTGRVHEALGSARYSFAAHMCARSSGPVIWISQVSQPDFLHPQGLVEFCDPGRFVFVRGPGHTDVLWSMEESLRAGAASLVVAQVAGRIDLTAGRRLQLAAEHGGGLGLVLTCGGNANPAAETRWLCSSLHEHPGQGDRDWTLSEWRCIKNKSGTLTIWTVARNDTAYHISMGSGPGQPAGSAARPPAGAVRSHP